MNSFNRITSRGMLADCTHDFALIPNLILVGFYEKIHGYISISKSKAEAVPYLKYTEGGTLLGGDIERQTSPLCNLGELLSLDSA